MGYIINEKPESPASNWKRQENKLCGAFEVDENKLLMLLERIDYVPYSLTNQKPFEN